MTSSLDCDAFVARGMGPRLIAFLEGPAGPRALAAAKAMHDTREARLKEVLKAYNLAHLYAGLCLHYETESLAELCRMVSADAVKVIRREINQVIEHSLPRLMAMLSDHERDRLDQWI